MGLPHPVRFHLPRWDTTERPAGTPLAPVLRVARKQKLPKKPLLKLSIFIIKIITSLVKVQMLQHGVKTPLE